MTGATLSVISLFGPADQAGALIETPPGGQWVWPGSCITSHTAQFEFEFGFKTVLRALWRVMWCPPKNGSQYNLRLVSCDNGPSNLQQIGFISNLVHPIGLNVYNDGADITAAFNALVAARVYKEFGWQMAGDGINPVTVYASRLELTWAP